MAQEVNNPHDALFKARFSQTATAIAFCRFYLPATLLALLDLARLEIIKDGFTDEKLGHHFADMLYRIPLLTGGTAYICLLIEHKSWPDGGVSLQLARYQILQLDELWQQGTNPLPVIVSVVLYHGKKPWDVPRNLAALFDLSGPAEILRPFVPDFSYYLCDLSQYDKIVGGPELAPALEALKYAFRRDLKERAAGILRHAAELQPTVAANQQIESLVAYWRATKQLNREEIATAMQEALPGYGHIKIPWIEQWRDQGRVEGRQEGLQEGLQKGLQEGGRHANETMVLTLLRHRFQEVDEATEARIRALSVTQLQKLGVAVLDFKQPQDLARWLRTHRPRRKSS